LNMDDVIGVSIKFFELSREAFRRLIRSWRVPIAILCKANLQGIVDFGSNLECFGIVHNRVKILAFQLKHDNVRSPIHVYSHCSEINDELTIYVWFYGCEGFDIFDLLWLVHLDQGHVDNFCDWSLFAPSVKTLVPALGELSII